MTEAANEEGPRSFSVVFQAIADGEAHAEASEEMQSLLKSLQDEAKNTNGSASGSMTIKLGLKVDAKGVATIAYSVDVKKPTKKRPGATMWVTKGGNLSPDNPRQQKLPLRDVSTPPSEARTVETTEQLRGV